MGASGTVGGFILFCGSECWQLAAWILHEVPSKRQAFQKCRFLTVTRKKQGKTTYMVFWVHLIDSSTVVPVSGHHSVLCYVSQQRNSDLIIVYREPYRKSTGGARWSYFLLIATSPQWSMVVVASCWRNGFWWPGLRKEKYTERSWKPFQEGKRSQGLGVHFKTKTNWRILPGFTKNSSQSWTRTQPESRPEHVKMSV